MASQTPTLADIAKRAGVSKVTVSKCLKNDPRYSQATRKKIQRLARSMGYRPNPLVTALMTQLPRHRKQGASEAIAIVSTTQGTLTGFEIHEGYVQGIERRADALGFGCERFEPIREGITFDRLFDVLRARGIHAFILLPPTRPEMELHPTALDGLVGAVIGHGLLAPRLHVSAPWYFQHVYLACEKMHALDPEAPVGLALSKLGNERTYHQYLGAYQAFHVERGLPAAPLFDRRVEQGPEAFRQWIEEHGIRMVLDQGVTMLPRLKRLPKSWNVRLFTLQRETATGRRISGIDQNMPLVGAKAVDLVSAYLYRNETGVPENAALSHVPGVWIDK